MKKTLIVIDIWKQQELWEEYNRTSGNNMYWYKEIYWYIGNGTVWWKPFKRLWSEEFGSNRSDLSGLWCDWKKCSNAYWF